MLLLAVCIISGACHHLSIFSGKTIVHTLCVLPGCIILDQRAIPGTLCPPSHVVPLPQRRAPAFPPLISLSSEGLQCFKVIIHCRRINLVLNIIYPLSEVKNTRVLSSTFASLSACMTCPTPQSSSARASPKGPRMVVLVNSLPAN